MPVKKLIFPVSGWDREYRWYHRGYRAVPVVEPVVPISTRGIFPPSDRRTSSQYHEYHHAVAPGMTTIPRSPTRNTCLPQGVEAAREKSDRVSARLGHG
jgi:hypothetical protein